ncbi:MAG: anti-sigma factor antagonist [Candidatus Sumerlaeota bacterium]|nr:anti-sigma factor antagonist [Candidatus Sumerlaeota bacterium]
MEILIYQNQDKLLVQLAGRVVLDECDRLKGSVISRISPGINKVSLDLSKVDFIDSAGLGALVGMKVTSNKNRATLSLLSPSKNVSDILVVSKLDSIFEIITGKEAEAILDSLAKPAFLISGDDSGSSAHDATAGGGPAFQAPPTAPAASTPRERIDQLCKTAVDFMRQRDYERAAQCYTDVLEIDPEYLPAINNLAIVYEKKPQWQKQAIEQWERVLTLSQSRGDQKHVERAQKHLQELQNL